MSFEDRRRERVSARENQIGDLDRGVPQREDIVQNGGEFERRLRNDGKDPKPASGHHGDEVADIVVSTIKERENSREVITLTESGSRVHAFRIIKDIVGDQDKNGISIQGKLYSVFMVVGRQSEDGRRGWRLDYDDVKGPHYNYFDHDRKVYGAVPFNGNLDQVNRLMHMLTSTYNLPEP